MKIFLTGGTGFIGSYILMKLLEEGHDVIVLARNPKKTKLFPKVINLNFVIGEMNDEEVIKECLQMCDTVIHVALFWGEQDSLILKKDTLSTVRLYELAKEYSIKRFIYTSSTAAVGYSHKIADEDSPLLPEDFYGASKASSEMYIRSMSANSDMITTIIRPGYTFGKSVIKGSDTENDSRFRDIVKKCQSSTEIELTKNDGTQFISVTDLVKIYLKALKQTSKFEIYFGLSSEFISWEEIAKVAILLSGSSSKIVLKDTGYSNEPNLFNVTKIERNFGFKFVSQYHIREHLRYLLYRV